MLSRVAENLYWLGRHLERAENAARMADVDHQGSLEDTRLGEGSIWDGLIAAFDAHQAYAAALAQNADLTPADFFVLSSANPGSIRSTIATARFLARGLREHISREVWEEINELHLALAADRRPLEPLLHDLCVGVRRRVQNVFGLYDNTAIRDEGREWFRCGLFLERADMTSRILDAKYHILLPSLAEVGGPLDRFQWMAILRSASAWEAYHKVVRGEINAPEVVNLLIFNRDFPRSLAFSVMAMIRHYRGATRTTPPQRRVEAERLLTLLDLDLAALDIARVLEEGLHEFLEYFQTRMIAVDRAMTRDIFRSLPEPAPASPVASQLQAS